METQSIKKLLIATVLVFLMLPVICGCGNGDDNYLIPKKPDTTESLRVVACLGNSITFGARQFLNDREKECYPALLGEMLGNNFDVGNFGCSGTCVLKNGNSPYWNVKEYTKAKEFLPNVVIIKFGTNDSRLINWPSHGREFEADLTALVTEFRNLSTRPRIFLCTPAVAYTNTIGADDGVITGEIIPAIERIAKNQNLTIIDLHEALQDKQNLFPDGIHPGIEGNRLIATTIYEVLAKEYSLKN